jgi:hypothetical protein
MRVISSGESSKRTGFARGAPRGIQASEEIMTADEYFKTQTCGVYLGLVSALKSEEKVAQGEWLGYARVG